MPSSVVFCTEPVPYEQDWYHDLHPVVVIFRALAKPPPSKPSDVLVYKNCRQGRLYHDFLTIDAAFVSFSCSPLSTILF